MTEQSISKFQQSAIASPLTEFRVLQKVERRLNHRRKWSIPFLAGEAPREQQLQDLANDLGASEDNREAAKHDLAAEFPTNPCSKELPHE